MVVASVRFDLRPGTSLTELAEVYERAAPMYRGQPGLIRKYFAGAEGVGAGIYLWETRQAAERFYSPEWRRMIADRYGQEPRIEFLECLLVVDNAAESVGGSRAA